MEARSKYTDENKRVGGDRTQVAQVNTDGFLGQLGNHQIHTKAPARARAHTELDWQAAHSGARKTNMQVRGTPGAWQLRSAENGPTSAASVIRFTSWYGVVK